MVRNEQVYRLCLRSCIHAWPLLPFLLAHLWIIATAAPIEIVICKAFRLGTCCVAPAIATTANGLGNRRTALRTSTVVLASRRVGRSSARFGVVQATIEALRAQRVTTASIESVLPTPLTTRHIGMRWWWWPSSAYNGTVDVSLASCVASKQPAIVWSRWPITARFLRSQAVGTGYEDVLRAQQVIVTTCLACTLVLGRTNPNRWPTALCAGLAEPQVWIWRCTEGSTEDTIRLTPPPTELRWR